MQYENDELSSWKIFFFLLLQRLILKLTDMSQKGKKKEKKKLK